MKKVIKFLSMPIFMLCVLLNFSFWQWTQKPNNGWWWGWGGWSVSNEYTITFVDSNWVNSDVVWTWEYGVETSWEIDYPEWTRNWYTLSWSWIIPATVPAEDTVITAIWTKKQSSGWWGWWGWGWWAWWIWGWWIWNNSVGTATWMTITLTPWWNVFSTPALISEILFSNWWDNITFSRLKSWQWLSVVPNIDNIKPLEWFLVHNSNDNNVYMTVVYQETVLPWDSILQKRLDLWWNFLWITSIVNPFNNIAWFATMSIDFTNNWQYNLLNSVNSSYVWNQNSATIYKPEYGESYWVFITSENPIYWWINNRQTNTQSSSCSAANFLSCIAANSYELCTANCNNYDIHEYSDEFQVAYAYAYDRGLTTMSTIDNAYMYGNLTRISMARMMSNYAINVLWLTPDPSVECIFSDVNPALDAQYDNWVTNICQLGLMWQNVATFQPFDSVTRAEFGTLLSRALNANDPEILAAMNNSNPYYQSHLNFLHNEGIMSDISNPYQTELRWYVMLMMMRADNSYSLEENCSLEERVACILSDDPETCLAECEGEEQTNTDGWVTIVATNSNDVVLRRDNISMAKFTVQPKLDNTRLTSFEIKGLSGLSATDLKVKVDGNVLEAGDYTVTTSWVLSTVAGKLDEAMDSDGIEIEVIFKSPKDDGTQDGKYPVALSGVNWAKVTKTFNKYIVPALVKVTAQENLWDETKYTFSVDKADESYEIEHFMMNGIDLWSIIDWQEETLGNGTSMSFITWVQYDVVSDSTYTVEFDKATYKDYFKVWTSYLKIFKAQD